jgi:hypothetical protein
MVIYLDSRMIVKARRTHAPRGTVSGCGRKIPTDWLIQLDNKRWYRVYAICYSNATSQYIRTKHAGERFLDTDCFDAINARWNGR